jgi:hypothetical protein
MVRSGLGALVLCWGCVGQIDESSPGRANEPPPGSGEVAITTAPPSGVRRLTVHEYDNALRDLLGDDSRPAAQVLPRDVRTPVDNDATTQVASQALVEGVELLALEAADRLLSDPERRDRIVGCVPEGPDDATCLRSFIERFGRKALRRALAESEVELYLGTIDLSIESGDFYTAVDTVLRALLQDPELLYRVELGEPLATAPGVFKLSGFEVATRLSFLRRRIVDSKRWQRAPSCRILHFRRAAKYGCRAAAHKTVAGGRLV